MRELALILIAFAFVAIFANFFNSRIEAAHRSDYGTTISIDPAQLTLSAGDLATGHIAEPF